MKPRHHIWPLMKSARALENDGFIDLVCLWALRFVVHIHAQRRPDKFARIPAVGPLLTHAGIGVDSEEHPVHPAKLLPQVGRRLEQMERNPPTRSGALVENIGLMGKILDLDAAAREVLLFACLALWARTRKRGFLRVRPTG